MMTSPSELSFDCKPQIYSMLPKPFGEQISSCDQQTQKIEEFLARLEEERLKIDAFKRELPLCMQLLTNAMEASRQQLQTQRTNQEGRPILEQFIPLKNTSNNSCNNNISDKEANLSADKANWMTSAQLWNQESGEEDEEEEETKPPPSPLRTILPPQEISDFKLGFTNEGKKVINGGGGAFLPFSSSSSMNCGEGFPELALANSSRNEEIKNSSSSSEVVKNICRRENSVVGGGSTEREQVVVSGGAAASNGSQTNRKARRCWSPDLHRRFVNALHMLGGSQGKNMATPKQIRELMKVDGLTNDEVKSHLQKYRLHTRRPSPSPQTSVAAGPQVVVLGGIWVPPEYAAAAAAHHHSGAQAAALYGAHAAHHLSPSFCSQSAQPGQQELYPAIAPPPPHNHQLHRQAMHHHQQQQQQQQQLHLYNKPPPLTQRGRNISPESDVRGGGGAGDPSESIEDGKSESGSWKADSGGGENGGERRRLDGEESNGSGVTLKF
ncbi:hypothetical protein ABFS83_08G145000 [Erythranthe nasuta]